MASTVTSFSDMTPSPRAVIDIDDSDLDPATVTATVLQISKWGQVPVNNEPRDVAGGLVVTDYTVPAGVPVVYRVQQFDAAGVELGLTLSLNAQVDIPLGWVVIQDPLAPGSAVLLRAHPDFAATLTRPRATRVYQAGTKSLALSGLQGAFRQVPLHCWTQDETDRESLAAILEQSLILVRTHPDMRLPGSFFASIADSSMITWGAQLDSPVVEDRDWWPIVGDGVTRPTLDVIVPVYSYDLFKAYLDEKYPPFGTYDDAAAEWSTYISAIRNPPPLV